MNLLDSMEDFGLPFAIDSFVKNETDSIALEKCLVQLINIF